MSPGLYGFLFGMWMLILIGGGIIVAILGPITIAGFGELDGIISSAIKAVIAIMLAVIWIVILSKMKNWIFKKEIHS